MLAAVLFYLISILKTFIIIIIDAYGFYFRHYSLCYRPMLEDHYLKIPICNELFYSNLVFRDLCVYIYVCILTLTLEKKMKLYVTRNLDEYVCVCVKATSSHICQYIYTDEHIFTSCASSLDTDEINIRLFKVYISLRLLSLNME